MSGKAFAIVGMRGMGKSTVVKQLLKPTNEQSRLIYDPNQEYKDFYPYPLLTFDQFADKVSKVQNAVIVVEEATVFLNNRGFNFNFLDLIVRARHSNNTIILVFHSFRAVPKYLISLLNYVVILKTGDNIKYIEQFENDALTREFIKMRNAPMLKGEGGKEYSPNIVFDLFDPKNFQ